MIDKITILEVRNNFVKMTFRLLKTVFKAWTALGFLFVCFYSPSLPRNVQSGSRGFGSLGQKRHSLHGILR